MNLPQDNVPVIGIISRLTEQKGLNLVMEKVDEMMKNNVQLIVLGSEIIILRMAFNIFVINTR